MSRAQNAHSTPKPITPPLTTHISEGRAVDTPLSTAVDRNARSGATPVSLEPAWPTPPLALRPLSTRPPHRAGFLTALGLCHCACGRAFGQRWASRCHVEDSPSPPPTAAPAWRRMLAPVPLPFVMDEFQGATVFWSSADKERAGKGAEQAPAASLLLTFASDLDALDLPTLSSFPS